jgi:hypothetical protein
MLLSWSPKNWSAALLKFNTQRVYRLEIANFLRKFSHGDIFKPVLWSVLPPVALLSFSLVHHYPSPFPVWGTKYMLNAHICTCTMCDEGGGGGDQINSCRKVPLHVTFKMTTFCLAFNESYSYLSTVRWSPPRPLVTFIIFFSWFAHSEWFLFVGRTLIRLCRRCVPLLPPARRITGGGWGRATAAPAARPSPRRSSTRRSSAAGTSSTWMTQQFSSPQVPACVPAVLKECEEFIDVDPDFFRLRTKL